MMKKNLLLLTPTLLYLSAIDTQALKCPTNINIEDIDASAQWYTYQGRSWRIIYMNEPRTLDWETKQVTAKGKESHDCPPYNDCCDYKIEAYIDPQKQGIAIFDMKLEH